MPATVGLNPTIPAMIRYSRGLREQLAKLLFVGSNPTRISKSAGHFGCRRLKSLRPRRPVGECPVNRLRVGKLVFRDPVLLCGVVYLLLYFDASGFLRLGLLAAVLHELGHILVYCIQQRRLPVIEVTMTGFCMRTAGERFSPLQRLVLAAAGPAVNFALAGVWAGRHWKIFLNTLKIHY